MRLSAKKLAFGVSILVFAAPCLFGKKVATDFDKKANFGQYKTFMWLRQPSLQDPIMNDRLKDDIDAELTAKGWTQVTENGDVGIVANGATQQQQISETFYTGFPGWRWHAGRRPFRYALEAGDLSRNSNRHPFGQARKKRLQT